MNYPRAVAIGLGLSAALVAAYLLLREPPSAAEAGRHATWTAAIGRPEAVAARPATLPAVAAGSPVRAAIAHAFRGTPPPRALLDRLEQGEVAALARELAAAKDPAAAVALFDLAALCASEGEAPGDAEASDERLALEAAGLAPATRARLAALVAARHAWQARFGPGCAEASFDPGLIRAQLEVTAARGDGASLERLALVAQRPQPKLESAALLGDSHAAFRLALEALPTQPSVGRSWLEAAARDDPEAQAYLGACLLAGCSGTADPVAARRTLELAARSGSLYALGLLASAQAPDGPRRWVRRDDLVAPVLPHDLEALGLDPATGYAWASIASTLADRGCFGFEFELTAQALEARPGLERTLRPGELADAQAKADELAAASTAQIRHALGCD